MDDKGCRGLISGSRRNLIAEPAVVVVLEDGGTGGIHVDVVCSGGFPVTMTGSPNVRPRRA